MASLISFLIVILLNSKDILSPTFRFRSSAKRLSSQTPDASLPLWRYWTTYKLGKGIFDRKVRIVAGDLNDGFKVVADFEKDYWPYTMFQFGNVLFPKCEIDGKVLIQPVAVKKYDNCALFI